VCLNLNRALSVFCLTCNCVVLTVFVLFYHICLVKKDTHWVPRQKNVKGHCAKAVGVTSTEGCLVTGDLSAERDMATIWLGRRLK